MVEENLEVLCAAANPAGFVTTPAKIRHVLQFLILLTETNPLSIEYVSLIENFLTSELSVGFDEKALPACSNLSAEQLNFFSRQLTEVDTAQHTRMVQVKPGEAILKPDGAPLHPWAADDDIRPVSAMFTHPYNSLAPIAIDHVKRQLLFFSRVAIVVPELRYGRTLADKRSNFAAYLKSVVELRPLVEDRSVVLLPHRGFYSNEIEGGAALVRNACNEDAAIVQWIDAHRPMLNDFASGAGPTTLTSTPESASAPPSRTATRSRPPTHSSETCTRCSSPKKLGRTAKRSPQPATWTR
ncbi:MAG: hypothetical protein WCA27_09950 [Candidatus Sulfotelmatobacter sp.]